MADPLKRRKLGHNRHRDSSCTQVVSTGQDEVGGRKRKGFKGNTGYHTGSLVREVEVQIVLYHLMAKVRG